MQVPFGGSPAGRAHVAGQHRTVILAPPRTALIMHPYRKMLRSPPFNQYWANRWYCFEMDLNLKKGPCTA